MTITLTPEHERIIQAQLATGKFHSVEEVLENALAPLRSRVASDTERDDTAKSQAAAERIRELRKGITLPRPEGMSLREYAHLGTDTNGRLRPRRIGLHAVVPRGRGHACFGGALRRAARREALHVPSLWP